MKTNRPSAVTTAQQISLRPFPSERVTGASSPPETRYEDAAAAPFSARNASVMIRREPSGVNANPYGVAPDEGKARISPRRPSGPTVNTAIESVPRSVTTTCRPSGVNAIWAGSAVGAESDCSAPAIGSRPFSSRW
jgi:hypothetical protein